MTQIHDVILLALVIAIGHIDPCLFGQPLGAFLIAEGFPGVIGELFQRTGMSGGLLIAVGDVLQFSRYSLAHDRFLLCWQRAYQHQAAEYGCYDFFNHLYLSYQAI